jgi:hypothetical protein
MPRRLRSPTLETHTVRLRLKVRRKPYFVSVAPMRQADYQGAELLDRASAAQQRYVDVLASEDRRSA